MTNSTPHLSGLEDWFRERPEWLQDATARILQNGKVGKADLEELVALCKREVGISIPVSTTLKSIRIPKGFVKIGKSSNTLRLNAIFEPKGINALAPRKPLEFGDEPLTVVYGASGSGKSGYVRALKHACGARNPGPLLGNVFLSLDEEASCKFKWSINGTAHDLVWRSSLGPLAELSALQIYDNSCAGVYVDEECEVAFEPLVLNLFTQLTDICIQVDKTLGREIEATASQKPVFPAEFRGTQAENWYGGLTRVTKAEEIQSRCQWTAELQTELTTLDQRLAEAKPSDKAKSLRKQKERFSELFTALAGWSERLSYQSCDKYRLARSDFLTKRRAADFYASGVFSKSPLDGVGTEIWKLLWEQARLYSEGYAYRGVSFPNTSSGARCVLCQQDLDSEAKERFISFEAFVKGQLETQAAGAEAQLSTLSAGLEGMSSEELALRMDSVSLDDNASRSVIASFRVALDVRRVALTDPGLTGELPHLPAPDDLKVLSDLASTCEEQATTFDRDAKDENRPVLEDRRRELKAHKWLSEQVLSIEADVKRLNQMHRLEEAKRLANTQQLSIKKSQLSDELITTAYVKRFQDQLEAFQANHIRVKLVKTRAERGHVLHRVQLDGCQKPIDSSQVLSDGEFRIVSLAAFLADVEGREDNGPFIFDDPITSSDQTFEEATAIVLAELCKSRQVIVFTHRLSLVELLEEACQKNNAKVCIKSLRRANWGIGDPDEAFSHLNNPGSAINYLLQQIPRARAAFEKSTAEYETEAKGLCSHFRIVVERLVEKSLMSDVLTRFRRSVQTKGKIRNLAKINSADCILIDDLMTKYSRYEHSQPAETPTPLPAPDEIEADITRAKNWLEEFSKRPAT